MESALVAYAGFGLAAGFGAARVWAIALPRAAHVRCFSTFRTSLATAIKTDDPKVYFAAYCAFMRGLAVYVGRGLLALVASSVLVVLIACALAKAWPLAMVMGRVSPWPTLLPDGPFAFTLAASLGLFVYIGLIAYLAARARAGCDDPMRIRAPGKPLP